MMSFLLGISKENRDAVVEALNVKYNAMRQNGDSQINSLYNLSNEYPFRIISNKSNTLKVIKN